MSESPYRVLAVTGADGFVGSHLVAMLRARADCPRRIVAIDSRRGAADAQWMPCDLTDAGATADVFGRLCPDGVVHLASAHAGADADGLFAANVAACANVLRACKVLPRMPRVLVAGSSAQYGAAGSPEPIDESHPLLADDPFGVSKCLQERWALAYAAAGGPPVVCVRLFNVIGPGQGDAHVPGAFLRQIALVLAGRSPQALVGNTDTRRDLVDVRDAAAAMWALMTAGPAVENGIFNIATGQTVLIDDVLRHCLTLVGHDVTVRRDPSRLRAVDAPVVVGDASRLRTATGWGPSIDWKQSVADAWEHVRPDVPRLPADGRRA